MPDTRLCPTCGTPIPSGTPAGLCPKCLLHGGIDSQSEVDSNQTPTRASPATGAAGFVPPSIEELAGKFPQLEFLELLGKGGMGAVYKARQRGLDRLVAVKILPPEIGHDAAFAERFTREARALARLSHNNIVSVYDFGQAPSPPTPLPQGERGDSETPPPARGESGGEGALFYIVMEFVDGANLRQTIRAGKLAAAEALAIVPQICEALQFAHDEGIVHRDIKPENILIDKRGRVKIADFGLAKLLGQDASDHSLTATHQVMGTLRYMAPEQMQGSREVDHRADIYSLGVVFYELLTGELPMGKFAPPSKKVQVDVRLDEIVLRALEQDPEQRYQHASEVKTDVDAIVQRGEPSKQPRRANQTDWVTLQARTLPRDATDLLMVLARSLMAAVLFLVLASVASLVVLPLRIPLAPILSMQVIGAVVFVFLIHAIWLWVSIRGVTVDASGLTMRRGSKSWLLTWNEIVRVESMSRGEAFRELWLPRLRLYNSVDGMSFGMSALHFFRIDCRGGRWCFCPDDRSEFVAAINRFAPPGVGWADALRAESAGVARVVSGERQGVSPPRDRVVEGHDVASPRPLPPGVTASAGSSDTELQAARGRVAAPAVGLLIAAGLNMLVVFFWLVVVARPFNRAYWNSPDWFGIGGFPFACLLLFWMIKGALDMLNLESHSRAMRGAMVAMLTPAGFPMGLWALAILSRSDVKAAFSSKTRSQTFGAVSVARPESAKGAATETQLVQAPADCLLLAAGIAFVTACGVALWLGVSASLGRDISNLTNPMIRGNLIGMSIGLAIYSVLVGVAGLLLRRLRGRLVVLLVAVIMGLFFPAVVALNVVMEIRNIPVWPVVIPLWLGMPAALWVVVTLFRDDVRRAFDAADKQRAEKSGTERSGEPEGVSPRTRGEQVRGLTPAGSPSLRAERPKLVPVLATINLVGAILLMLMCATEPPPAFTPNVARVWQVWETVDSVLGFAMAAGMFAASIGLFLWKPWARKWTLAVCVFGLALLVLDMPYLARFALPDLYAEIQHMLATEGVEPEMVDLVAMLSVVLLVGGMVVVGVAWLIGQLVYFTRPRVVAAFESPGEKPSKFLDWLFTGTGAVVGVLSVFAPLALLLGLAAFFQESDGARSGSREAKSETAQLTFNVAGPQVEVLLNGQKVPVSDDGTVTLHVRPGDYETIFLKGNLPQKRAYEFVYAGEVKRATERDTDSIWIKGPITLEFEPGSGQPTVSDLAAIQGRWTVVAQVKAGAFLLEQQRGKWIEFDKDNMRSDLPQAPLYLPLVTQVRVGLDSAATPRHFNNLDTGAKGIYRLDGDTLTLTVADAGQPRPTEFVSRSGPGTVTLTLCRRGSASATKIAGIGSVSPATKADAATLNDRRLLEDGMWKVVRVMNPDIVPPPDPALESFIVFKKDGKMTWISVNKETGQEVGRHDDDIKIDASRTPKRYESVVWGTEPRVTSTKWIGIYELEGDTLKMYQGPDERWLESFTAQPGLLDPRKATTYIELQRVPPPDKIE